MLSIDNSSITSDEWSNLHLFPLFEFIVMIVNIFVAFIWLSYLFQLSLKLFTSLYEFFNVSCGSEQLYLLDVLLTEAHSKYFPDGFLASFWADVGINTSQNDTMYLNELVHNLLIWLKFKLGHFAAKPIKKPICKAWHYDCEYQRNLIDFWRRKVERQWNNIKNWLRGLQLGRLKSRAQVANIAHWNSCCYKRRAEELNGCFNEYKIEVAIRVGQGKQLLCVCFDQYLQ